jgi:hypothetical protein
LRAAFTKAFQGLTDWVDKPLTGTDVPVNDLIARGKNLHALRCYQDHTINLVKAHNKDHYKNGNFDGTGVAKENKAGSNKPMFDEKEEKEFMTLTVHDYDREYRHFDENQKFVR